jgi:hypothetical protein
MWHKEIVSDASINQKVTQGLSARGMRAPCSIVAHTTKGVVTLSGNIAFEHQRNAAIQAARHLDGVTRVIDQLHVKVKASPWKLEPQKPSPAPVAVGVKEHEEQPEVPAADPPPIENVTAPPTCDTPACP